MVRDWMSSACRPAISVLAAILVLLPVRPCSASDWQVISFPGNAREWNARLGVSELRVPCSGPPANCLKKLATLASDEGVERFTMSMSRDQGKVAQYAAEYSDLSRSKKNLRGIGIDDFVYTLRDWRAASEDERAPVRSLQQAITNAKAANPALEFGITLYEDQLQLPLFDDTQLPPSLRSQIDRVSLFIHYRKNGPRYREYVRRVRDLFPKARIIAGAYAYDRIHYLPCAQGGDRSCTPAQESRLFEQAFSIQVDMLKRKEIDGIEFFPGYFGVEQEWASWKKPRNCKPGGIQDCLELTRTIRARALEILQEARSGR